MLAVAITPAGLMELVRSCCSISGGHPDYTAGWLLRYMFRGLLSVHCTLRPTCSPSHLSDLLHQRLRRLRFLHRRSDCFRVERTKFPGGTFTRSHPAPFHGAHVMSLFETYRNRNCPRVALVPAWPFESFGVYGFSRRSLPLCPLLIAVSLRQITSVWPTIRELSRVGASEQDALVRLHLRLARYPPQAGTVMVTARPSRV